LVAVLAATRAGAQPPTPTETFTATIFITRTPTSTPSQTPSKTATRTPTQTSTRTRTITATPTVTRAPARPVISISNAQAQEGNAGDLTSRSAVPLPEPSPKVVTVQSPPSDGPPHAGPDYRPAAGTLTFPAGRKGLFMGVQVIGDTVNEASET